MPSADSTTQFFVTGGTLTADAPSYVERQADRELQAALRAGEYCYVLDSRQVGKSSLLIRAMAVLRSEGIRVASCDLQRLGSGLTAEQFYQGLLVQIGRGIGIERELLRTWQALKEEAPFARFRTVLYDHAILQSEQPLVVLIDEIELLRRQAFDTDEFLVGIRSFFTDRADDPAFCRLTVCLAGSSTPDALIQNANVTPFNIGRRIIPTDFTLQEARPFADALTRTGRDGDALFARVLYWTSGHPYLSQRVCKAVLEDAEVKTAADVDAVVSRLYFGRDPEDGQHLSFINRRIEADPDFQHDPAGLLAIYQQIYRRFGRGSFVEEDPRNHWHTLLKLSGLTLPWLGMLEVRNRIYHTVFGREWIQEHMPNAEVRRQNAARRKGFLQAALLFGTISLVIAILGWSAYSNGRVADARARENARLAKAASAATDKANARALENAKLAETNGKLAHTNAEVAAARQIAFTDRERALKDRKKALAAALKQKGIAETSVVKEKTASKRARNAESKAIGEATRANRIAYITNMNLVQQAWEETPIQVGRVLELLEATRNSRDRNFEWGYWNRLCDLDLMTLKGPTSAITSAAFSADGKRIVTGSWDNTAKVWFSDPHDWKAAMLDTNETNGH